MHRNTSIINRPMPRHTPKSQKSSTHKEVCQNVIVAEISGLLTGRLIKSTFTSKTSADVLRDGKGRHSIIQQRTAFLLLKLPDFIPKKSKETQARKKEAKEHGLLFSRISLLSIRNHKKTADTYVSFFFHSTYCRPSEWWVTQTK